MKCCGRNGEEGDPLRERNNQLTSHGRQYSLFGDSGISIQRCLTTMSVALFKLATLR